MKYKKLCLFALILGLASCSGSNASTSSSDKPTLPTTSEQESIEKPTDKPTTSEEAPSLDPTTSETPSTSESTSEIPSTSESTSETPSTSESTSEETSTPETSEPETSLPESSLEPSVPESSLPESSEDTTTPETSTPEVPTGKKLATPKNLKVEDWYLNWSPVSHADYYRVTINDIDITVDTNTQRLTDILTYGVRNVLTVQAFNKTNKYEPSDIATLKYDFGGPFEGFKIIEDKSYVSGLTIKEENGNQVIEVPFNEIAGEHDETIPDLVISNDYTSTDIKMYGEENDSTFFVIKDEGNPNAIKLSFKQMGEVDLYVVLNGSTPDKFYFDKITIRTVKVSSFVDFNIKVMEWDSENNDYKNITTNEYNVDLSLKYAQLVACEENDEVKETEVITWTILEGKPLVNMDVFPPSSQAYLTFKGVKGKVVLQAATVYGDVDTITINIK